MKHILTFLLVFSILNFTFATTIESEEKSSEEVKSEQEERLETLQYGLDSEVATLVRELLEEDEDEDFTLLLADIFTVTRNTSLKDSLINYFTKFENPSIKEYALYILEDPYDEKSSTVTALIEYVSILKFEEAGESLVAIIENEEEKYFNEAILALGEIGGTEEAQYLVEYLENDLTTGERQSVVKALAQIADLETYDTLVELVEDEDENTYVRMYSAEAIGKMKPVESTEILLELFSSTDPNLREYAVKGLTNNESEDAIALIISALKDDYYKVRVQAINSVKEMQLMDAAPSLLYRAKNDSETVVKNACYDALATLDYKKGIDYMVDLLEDEKVNDTVKSNIAKVFLEQNTSSGVDAVIELALKVVKDDKKKNLRYALGKEFAKYENSKFDTVCEAYLASEDVSTKGTGLDIFKKNDFMSLRQTVQKIAEEDKSSILQSKAKTILES